MLFGALHRWQLLQIKIKRNIRKPKGISIIFVSLQFLSFAEIFLYKHFLNLLIKIRVDYQLLIKVGNYIFLKTPSVSHLQRLIQMYCNIAQYQDTPNCTFWFSFDLNAFLQTCLTLIDKSLLLLSRHVICFLFKVVKICFNKSNCFTFKKRRTQTCF